MPATARDMQRLVGVHPTLILAVLKILTDLPMFVVCGVRTVEEQQVHYAKGRTTPGPGVTPSRPLGRTVTNCDGLLKKSNHQVHTDGYGHAVDFGFLGPDPFGEHQNWPGFGAKVEALHLVWGGRFHSPIDLDHAELP